MAARTPAYQTGNRLLDSLPPDEVNRLKSSWEVTRPTQAHALYREDGLLSHVYFPVSGIYASVVRLEDGRTVEASTVGNEGIVGVAAILDLDFSPKTATAAVTGDCLRLPVSALREAMTPGGPLDRVLHRYAAYALRNAYQTVACNTIHSAQERLCRWLLTNQDRLGKGQIPLTHELLAQLLGIRRQTVTVIAGTLEAAGLISCQRAAIRIRNRKGLEAASCECYAVSRSLYQRIVLPLEEDRN
jgi:CRP-like cAMP-binding protein